MFRPGYCGHKVDSTLYDDEDALYVVFKGNPRVLETVIVIVKIELKTKKMLPRCATLCLPLSNETGFRLLKSRTYGIVLVDGLSEIYNIQEFDFNNRECDNNNPSPLNINVPTGKTNKTKKPRFAIDPPNLQFCQMFSIKGDLYVTSTNPYDTSSMKMLHIFFLNTSNKCWDELFSFDHPGLDICISSFVFREEPYLLLKPEDSEDRSS